MAKQPEKIQKNVDLVSQIATRINAMRNGERIRVTPFAHSIRLSNGSHPHVETIKAKLMEALLWQDITSKVKFIPKNNQICEIEKIEEQENQSEVFVRKEVRTEISNVKNQLDSIQASLLNLIKKKK